MKKYMTLLVCKLALALVVVFNPAQAAERFKAFELAESGQTVYFLMSAEEIAIEKAQGARQEVLLETIRPKPIPRFKVFEMGEGGHTVAFRLTPEESAAMEAENRDRAPSHSTRAETSKPQTAGVELAESGQMIAFPHPTMNQQPVGDDIELVQSPAANEDDIDAR
jgi:hypothetical protein